jgi:hypothetical protein
MKTINHLLTHVRIADARSALYYLSRYLKQAAIYERHEKDIFDEADQSSPSEEVRALTLSLIAFIEREQGIKAAQFDDDTYDFWSDHVSEVEASLDPEATPSEVERAREFVNAFAMPATKDPSSL